MILNDRIMLQIHHCLPEGILPVSGLRGEGLPEPIIIPYDPALQQPASYDLILGSIDTLGAAENVYTRRDGSRVYLIASQQFILGSTLEKVKIPTNMVARIEGKSSLARNGIMVHTAGFIDPGFEGTLTLEITNHHSKPFPLEIGMKIAQLAIQEMNGHALRPYGHPDLGSHYQGQEGPTKSWLG